MRRSFKLTDRLPRVSKMLPWLLRLRLSRPFPALPSISRPPRFLTKSSVKFPPTRSIQTSSYARQRYQYVRFEDPYAQSSSSGGGKGGGGGRGYWQNLWARFTPGQRLLLIGFGGGAPIFYVTHLETVAPTGRRRFIFMSRSMEETLGKMVTITQSPNLSHSTVLSAPVIAIARSLG